MHRRTVLATLASASLSGCVGAALSDHVSNRREISVSAVQREPPPTPTALDPDGRPTGLAFDVDIVDSAITSGTPARVAFRYTNTDTDTLRLNINPDSPDPHYSTQRDPGVVLLSDAYTPTPVEDACWKPQSELFPVPAVAHQYPLEPGEDVVLPYEVWAAPKQDNGCIQPGTYEFEVLYASFTLQVTEKSESA